MFRKPLALKSKLSISWTFQTHHNLVHNAKRSKYMLRSHDRSYKMQDDCHLHCHSFHWLPPSNCMMKYLVNHYITCAWKVPNKFFVIFDHFEWYDWKSRCNNVVIDQLGEYCDLLVAMCGSARKVRSLERREQIVANNVC